MNSGSSSISSHAKRTTVSAGLRGDRLQRLASSQKRASCPVSAIRSGLPFPDRDQVDDVLGRKSRPDAATLPPEKIRMPSPRRQQPPCQGPPASRRPPPVRRRPSCVHAFRVISAADMHARMLHAVSPASVPPCCNGVRVEPESGKGGWGGTRQTIQVADRGLLSSRYVPSGVHREPERKGLTAGGRTP